MSAVYYSKRCYALGHIPICDGNMVCNSDALSWIYPTYNLLLYITTHDTVVEEPTAIIL